MRQFVDDLSLAFWTAPAVSPSDVSAIKRWAKLLIVLDAADLLAIAVLVVSHAINILS